MSKAFDNSQFWYYYNSIVPEKKDNPLVAELDLKAEIEKHRAIIVLCNDGNLGSLVNGFINDVYKMY